MSSTIQPEGKFLYKLSFPIRWGDMDALGHVNNIMYFRFFEQVRLSWYESLGRQALGTEETGCVIVDNHAEYLKPLVYPADITVSMGGHSPGRSSFITSYIITDTINSKSEEQKLYTRGSAKVVWIETAKNKSMRLPDDVRQLLAES